MWNVWLEEGNLLAGLSLDGSSIITRLSDRARIRIIDPWEDKLYGECTIYMAEAPTYTTQGMAWGVETAGLSGQRSRHSFHTT